MLSDNSDRQQLNFLNHSPISLSLVYIILWQNSHQCFRNFNGRFFSSNLLFFTEQCLLWLFVNINYITTFQNAFLTLHLFALIFAFSSLITSMLKPFFSVGKLTVFHFQDWKTEALSLEFRHNLLVGFCGGDQAGFICLLRHVQSLVFVHLLRSYIFISFPRYSDWSLALRDV